MENNPSKDSDQLKNVKKQAEEKIRKREYENSKKINKELKNIKKYDSPEDFEPFEIDEKNNDYTGSEIYEYGGYQMDYKEKKEFNYYVFIFVIIFIITLIFIIIFFIFYEYEEPVDTKDYQNLNIDPKDINYGAVIFRNDIYKNSGIFKKKMIKEKQYLVSKNTKCKEGFYGKNCEFQVHDSNFYDVGMANLEYTTENVNEYVNLSLDYKTMNIDKNSCTSICKKRSDCKGVLYDHYDNICELIISDCYASGVSSFEKDLSGSYNKIYLKNQYYPLYKDKIIGFSNKKLKRYYIDRESDLISNIKPNIIKKLDKIPYRISNYGNYTGIWTQNIYELDNFKRNNFSIDSSNIIYVDRGKGEYNLPLFLQKLNYVYVLYS